MGIQDTDSVPTSIGDDTAESPTSPPIKEYKSNVAAAFTFDRTPAETVATEEEEEETIAVGSAQWYDSGRGDDSSAADAGAKTPAWITGEENQDWKFESYFRGPVNRNSATAMTVPLLLGSVMSIVIGIGALILVE